MPEHKLIREDFPPKDIALSAFQVVANAPPEIVAHATDWIRSGMPLRLSLSDCTEDFRAFLQKQKAESEHAESVLEALFSLEGIRSALGWTGASFAVALGNWAAETNAVTEEGERLAQTKESLQGFFQRAGPLLEHTKKAQRIYDGVVPNFHSCSSLVEFRPVFDEGRAEIHAGILSATLTLKLLSAETGSEPSPVSLQLDARDIRLLQEELERMKRKLSALRNFVEPDTRLINPSKSLPRE